MVRNVSIPPVFRGIKQNTVIKLKSTSRESAARFKYSKPLS